MMTGRSIWRRAGLAAAAAGLLLPGCSFRGVDSIPLPGGPDLGSDPKTIKVEFENVLDLVPQSVVKLNDVSVGKVTKVELSGWHALVTMKVRKDTRLPDNARATISQTSLLGEKFVALSNPPAGEPGQGDLDSGDLIPLARTRPSTDIEEVLSAFSMILNGGGLEQVSTITRELNAAMSGREPTIRSVLRRVNQFAGTLDRNRGAIVRALDSIDRLTARLSAERKTIDDTIDKTGPAVEVLNSNRADLTKMLVSLDKLSRTTTSVIKRSKEDTLANLKALDTSLRNLNKAGADLPNALETMITFPFPPTFSNVLRGDYGNVRITLDLDMRNLARNLLGGTPLEGLVNQGEQIRDLLRPPNLSLPQTPPGVLPQTGGPAGGQPPGAGSGGGGTGGPSNAPTSSPPGSPSNTPPDLLPSIGGPRAMAPDPGLQALMMGGLS